MASPRSTRYEYGITALLVLFWGFVGLNRVGIGFIFPKIVPEFHMAMWQAGLLISGTSVTWAFSSWIGGWLSDRYGRRNVLLPAVGFTCLMTAAMGGAWNFLSMFVVRDLLGIGDGVGWSVGEATINEESAPQRRGFNQAVFTAGYTLIGAGLGAIIITTLTNDLGWRWVFPIIGAAGMLVLIALYAVMREPPVRTEHHPIAWRAGVRQLRDPSMLAVTIAGCAVLSWLQVTIGFNVLFLTRVRQFSLVEAGGIAAVWGFSGVAGQIILPLISDLWGRKRTVMVSALACAVILGFYIGGGYGTGEMRLLLGLSGFFGWGLLPIVLATCVSELVSDELRGAALGMTNFFAVIFGTTVMPVIGGLVADHFGLGATLWLCVGSEIVVAIAIMTVRETAPRVVLRAGVAD
ncbi:MAG: MFS transporter [Alphaproteobacteria bacterium]|nr:MFS transporter [Alphaproteobacteria bacterium]